jgi:hypothetical protein
LVRHADDEPGVPPVAVIGYTVWQPRDGRSAAIVLVAAGASACWLPAWRATKVAPARALGTDEY